MSDIRQWLEELGLGQYANAFDENEVTLDLACDITDTDLEKLGVAILGHRKTLLRAIDKLGEPQPQPEAEPSENATAPDQAGAPVRTVGVREAERRQLTVMFCDLVGSTELSVRLDPEELRKVMAAYQKTAGAVIERYEGHVAQYLGDGVMTYFGWPKAHEDDAQRAIRAGLEIVEAVGEIEAPAPLSVRVGISTGPVVVGETGGGDASIPKAAVGETPNLAARVQGLAAPNTVAIAEATRRLVGGVFELEDVGSQELKGIEGAVSIYRVLGESAAESRFEAAQIGGLTPLVGRETEISLVLDRWDEAKDGEGQVMLLSGEAGIGKSRITQELRERLAGEPHTRLRYQCSPYHTNSAFYAIIEQIERASRFGRDDDADARLDKLEALLGASSDNVGAVAPLIAAMLSLPVERYPPLNLEPIKQKEMTITALANGIATLGRLRPVLVIFEDAHWADPTTLETLGAVIARIQEAPVLVVITYRPEFEPPWTGHGHVTTLTLNRLSRKLGADMVAKVTGGKALPDEVLDQIVAKTDGVPLFVEELTKTVLEAGFLQDAGDHFELDGPLPPLAIPSTLQDSLMARLDRLSMVKEVAQIGACIGREFTQVLIAAVSPLGGNELQGALAELVKSELVFIHGTPPDATYVFKHGLVRDVAYGSLLRSRRQDIHGRIAATLLERSPETAENVPELLAHHYSESGLAQQAFDYWLRAGERANERSANIEALNHFANGLTQLAAMPETEERRRQELRLQIARGTPLIAAKGFGAKETVAAYSRAIELSDELGETTLQFPALYGLCVNHTARAEHLAAKEVAERFLTLAQDQPESGPKLMGHRICGLTYIFQGEPAPAAEHLRQTLALYKSRDHHALAYRYGQDPRVAALALMGWAKWLLGYPDQAAALRRDANAEASKLDHAHTVAYALFFAGSMPESLSRDLKRAEEFGRSLVAFSEEQRFPTWVAFGTATLGWVAAMNQRGGSGAAAIEGALANLRADAIEMFGPLLMLYLAEVNQAKGEFETARRTLNQSLSLVDKNDERWIEAELHRALGECHRSASEEREAEACFRTAIRIGRDQEAKSWELRAAASLARLWRCQGKTREARKLLVPVYEWFTEGFDTADLKEAKALLDELK